MNTNLKHTEMNHGLAAFIEEIKSGKFYFRDVIEYIEASYLHRPTAFKNGDTYNETSQNQGSAKVFSFAKINSLTEEDTLHLFAEHYQSVLNTPEGTDHQNIRQFMKHGWQGIQFEGQALTEK